MDMIVSVPDFTYLLLILLGGNSVAVYSLFDIVAILCSAFFMFCIARCLTAVFSVSCLALLQESSVVRY